MLVLGLQGSPRKKGNTDFLLSTFMAEAEKRGADTCTIDVCRKHIDPCKELIVCEKKGYCPIDDDMKHEIYPLLHRADVVVAATPIFFYNATAQLKALIDRCQTLWARKYRLNLADPGSKMRKGFVLSVAATRGKNLFEGLHLTAKYFFDAIAAEYHGSLTYPAVEHRRDMEKHPTVVQDVEQAVEGILQPFSGRQSILFVSRGNDCRSQMAAAYARFLSGDRIDAVSCGIHPAESVNPLMIDAMAEDGVDMFFHRPMPLADAFAGFRPDRIVTLCGDITGTGLPDAPVTAWAFPDPSAGKPEDYRRLRDDIKKSVRALVPD